MLRPAEAQDIPELSAAELGAVAHLYRGEIYRRQVAAEARPLSSTRRDENGRRDPDQLLPGPECIARLIVAEGTAG